ncbi:MAG: hypothetical protein FWG23_06370 [Eggerthellaceae bacterium]|nr:hypothetical protein [Eggerthellaceae bacterium]
MNKAMKVEQRIEGAVVRGYKAIENGVVSGYKAIEKGVVSRYQRIEDRFVDAFLTLGNDAAEQPNPQKPTTPPAR